MTKLSCGSKKGFTLLEVLLVIGIIAILAGIVILAINPSKQLADARDAQRRSDVSALANAVYQYAIDSGNNMQYIIDTYTIGATCETDVAAMEAVLVPDFISAMPVDPTFATLGSAYWMGIDATSLRLTVCAPAAENDSITITK